MRRSRRYPSGKVVSSMQNRIRIVARQLYLMARTAQFWPWLLAVRLFPPPEAAHARALERQGSVDEALSVWQRIPNRSASAAEVLRLRMKRLRQATSRQDWVTAVTDLAEIHRAIPQDRRIAIMLANRALSAARIAQSEGRWLEACCMWLVFARVTPDKEKAKRNLIQSARLAAESADSIGALKQAIEAWRLVQQFDASIKDAHRGIMWCQLTIAREAERAGDLGTAREYWQAAVDTAPEDPRPRDALRRLEAAAQRQSA